MWRTIVFVLLAPLAGCTAADEQPPREVLGRRDWVEQQDGAPVTCMSIAVRITSGEPPFASWSGRPLDDEAWKAFIGNDDGLVVVDDCDVAYPAPVGRCAKEIREEGPRGATFAQTTVRRFYRFGSALELRDERISCISAGGQWTEG